MPILKVKVVNESGAGVAGQTVAVTDCTPLETNTDGMVQFLASGNVTINVGGQDVWTGEVASAKSPEVFQMAGGGFVRQ